MPLSKTEKEIILETFSISRIIFAHFILFILFFVSLLLHISLKILCN